MSRPLAEAAPASAVDEVAAEAVAGPADEGRVDRDVPARGTDDGPVEPGGLVEPAPAPGLRADDGLGLGGVLDPGGLRLGIATSVMTAPAEMPSTSTLNVSL